MNRQAGAGTFVVLLTVAVVIVVGIIFVTDHGHKPKPKPVPAQTTATVIPLPDTSTSWAQGATRGRSTGPTVATTAARAFITSYTLFLRGKLRASAITDATPALRRQLSHWTGTLPTYDPPHIVRLRVVAQGSGGVDATALMGVDNFTYGIEVILVSEHGQWLAKSVPSSDQTR